MPQMGYVQLRSCLRMLFKCAAVLNKFDSDGFWKIIIDFIGFPWVLMDLVKENSGSGMIVDVN